MSIKKKVGMGLATLSLGAIMALGGTFAAFNDVETISNSFAAGTLDLDVQDLDPNNEGFLFKLSNLKPKDKMTRVFTLHNMGSLAIEKVLLNAVASGWNPTTNEYTQRGGTPATEDGFLQQFRVNIFLSDENYGDINLLENTKTLTLYDLVNGNLDAFRDDLVDGTRVNISPPEDWGGLPAELRNSPGYEYDIVTIELEFVDDPATHGSNEGPLAGLYMQNRYQGQSIDVKFFLEATQFDGIHGYTNDYHGQENQYAEPRPQDEVNP